MKRLKYIGKTNVNSAFNILISRIALKRGNVLEIYWSLTFDKFPQQFCYISIYDLKSRKHHYYILFGKD